MTTELSPAIRAALAPTGKLRVGLNFGNFLLTKKPPPGGEPGGIAPDLGREIARRAGLGIAFVHYDQAGKLADGGKAGAWDVAFLANEPVRAAEIDFSPAYLEIEASYLVPAGSPIRMIADVDRPGVRIAVADRAAYDLYLSRSLKHAQLLRAEGIDGSYRLWVAEKLDALAGLKPRLVADAEKHPGSRVLEGCFSAVQQSIGTPKGRDAAAKYLREFVADAKSTGLVAKVIEANGVRGVSVVP
ncbi:MAG: transporter substrate-binding domain-containing protein [Burkholderiales bacterium]